MAAPAFAHDDEPRRLVSSFTDSLRDASGAHISSDALAKRLGVNKERFAKMAGVHRNTLRTSPDSDLLQERLREMVKVLTAAIELTKDETKAMYWYRNEPIRDYRGMTAAELVTAGKVDAVLGYIEDLHNGAAG